MDGYRKKDRYDLPDPPVARDGYRWASLLDGQDVELEVHLDG